MLTYIGFQRRGFGVDTSHEERFPRGKYGKLKQRADGPFRVLQLIVDSTTFNVADLSPFHEENYLFGLEDEPYPTRGE